MGEESKGNVSGAVPIKGIADVHLTEVRSLLSLQKLVEELVPEQDGQNQGELDPEIQQQYRKELREKLRRMPPKDGTLAPSPPAFMPLTAPSMAL